MSKKAAAAENQTAQKSYGTRWFFCRESNFPPPIFFLPHFLQLLVLLLMLLFISLPFDVDVPSTPFTSVVIVFVLGGLVGPAAATPAAVAASVVADNVAFPARPAHTADGAFAADVSESRRYL